MLEDPKLKAYISKTFYKNHERSYFVRIKFFVLVDFKHRLFFCQNDESKTVVCRVMESNS